MSSAEDGFYYLARFRVVVYKSCLYAVWPKEVAAHLRAPRHARIIPEIRTIAQQLSSWPNLCHTATELELPTRLDEAVPYIPIYTDGQRCQLVGGTCSYVSRSVGSMKHHWRLLHKWSPGQSRGGSGAKRQTEVAERQARALADVSC